MGPVLHGGAQASTNNNNTARISFGTILTTMVVYARPYHTSSTGIESWARPRDNNNNNNKKPNFTARPHPIHAPREFHNPFRVSTLTLIMQPPLGDKR